MRKVQGPHNTCVKHPVDLGSSKTWREFWDKVRRSWQEANNFFQRVLSTYLIPLGPTDDQWGFWSIAIAYWQQQILFTLEEIPNDDTKCFIIDDERMLQLFGRIRNSVVVGLLSKDVAAAKASLSKYTGIDKDEVRYLIYYMQTIGHKFYCKPLDAVPSSNDVEQFAGDMSQLSLWLLGLINYEETEFKDGNTVVGGAVPDGLLKGKLELFAHYYPIIINAKRPDDEDQIFVYSFHDDNSNVNIGSVSDLMTRLKKLGMPLPSRECRVITGGGVTNTDELVMISNMDAVHTGVPTLGSSEQQLTVSPSGGGGSKLSMWGRIKKIMEIPVPETSACNGGGACLGGGQVTADAIFKPSMRLLDDRYCMVFLERKGLQKTLQQDSCYSPYAFGSSVNEFSLGKYMEAVLLNIFSQANFEIYYYDNARVRLAKLPFLRLVDVASSNVVRFNRFISDKIYFTFNSLDIMRARSCRRLETSNYKSYFSVGDARLCEMDKLINLIKFELLLLDSMFSTGKYPADKAPPVLVGHDIIGNYSKRIIDNLRNYMYSADDLSEKTEVSRLFSDFPVNIFILMAKNLCLSSAQECDVCFVDGSGEVSPMLIYENIMRFASSYYVHCHDADGELSIDNYYSVCFGGQSGLFTSIISIADQVPPKHAGQLPPKHYDF